MTDKRTHLSEHFTIREAGRSEYAIRNGIDNTLPSIFYENAMNIAHYILEPIRENFGAFSPQSWYRGNKLNELIGGSNKSQHCTASAVDIEIPGITNLELALWIEKNLEFDQLILEMYDGSPSSGWVHCSWKKAGNRNECLRYNGKEYLKGLQ